jgi:hypothetical protein
MSESVLLVAIGSLLKSSATRFVSLLTYTVTVQNRILQVSNAKVQYNTLGVKGALYV